MNQPSIKARSKAWIWIIVILLVILACCCAAAGGSYFYLRSQNLTVREIISNELEIPQSIQEPVISTAIPAEPVQPVPQVEEETANETQSVAAADKLVLSTNLGIWLMNETSHESTQINNMPLEAPWDLQEGMSPDHRMFAYLSGFGGASVNPWLVVVDLENQTVALQMELTGPLTQPGIELSVGDPAFEATRAMEFTNSLAWSPDGQRLAFVGGMEGDSADVYLFNRNDLSITRLSEEAGHATALHWSPDGQFIAYVTVESFGTGAGMSMLGLWVYDVQNQQPRLLEELVSSGENFLGWRDSRTFLINSWDAMCERYNLRAVDVVSGSQEVVVNGCFSGVAYNPQQKEGLLSVTEFNQEYCNCGQSLEPGTYIFGEGFPFKKFEYILAYTIDFIPEGQLFAIYTDLGLEYIYQNNMAVSIPPEVQGLKPFPSPDGRYWAWASYFSGTTGLWAAETNTNPVEISPFFTGTPVWSQDGQTIYFVEDGLLFSASAPDFQGEILMEIPNGEMLGLVR